VMDGSSNLIPLPQQTDPNAVLRLDLKLASRSTDANHVAVAAPIVNAPVMLAEWKLEPDTGQRLAYQRGSLTPLGGVPDFSGFAQFARMFTNDESGRALRTLLVLVALLAGTLIIWRWTVQGNVHRFSERHIFGTLLGLLALVLAGAAFFSLAVIAGNQKADLPRDVSFLAPVQQAGSDLKIEVANLSEKLTFATVIAYGWPALLALALWAYTWLSERAWLKPLGS